MTAVAHACMHQIAFQWQIISTALERCKQEVRGDCMYDVILISLAVSAIVGCIIYFMLRGDIRNVCTQLRDVQKYSAVGRLKDEFQTFGQDVVNRIEALKRLSCARAIVLILLFQVRILEYWQTMCIFTHTMTIGASNSLF